MQNTRVVHIILIALFSWVIFFNLGSDEIQPWDEALYAVRAKSILKFDCWWDQTDYSLGGLYSSTYPPLSVWAIAISIKVFGESPFSVRLFSAVCSVLSMFLIYFIGERFLNSENVLFAPLLLLTAFAWNYYSRQGMTDIPLVCFLLLCFFSFIKFLEGENSAQNVAWGLVFGLSFFLALMTKIVISLLPLLFVIVYGFLDRNSSKFRMFLVFVLLGILLASVWYVDMAMKYGAEFTKALFPPHIYQAVEGNFSEYGIFYIFNQLIISSPLFIFAFFSLFCFRGMKRYFSSFPALAYYYALLLWFFLGFVIFSLSVTKLPHYVVYLIPPAVIFSILFYEKADELVKSKRWQVLIYLLLLFCFVWSLSFDFRQSFKLLINFQLPEIKFLLFLLLFALAGIGVIVTPSRFLDRIRTGVFSSLWMVIVFAVFTRVVLANVYEKQGYVQGGEVTAEYLRKVRASSFVYLYHNYAEAEAFNPQLAWYLDEYMCSWRSEKTYYPLPLSPIYFKLGELHKIRNYYIDYLVYFVPKDIELARSVLRYLTQHYKLISYNNRYVIFRISEINGARSGAKDI